MLTDRYAAGLASIRKAEQDLHRCNAILAEKTPLLKQKQEEVAAILADLKANTEELRAKRENLQIEEEETEAERVALEKVR